MSEIAQALCRTEVVTVEEREDRIEGREGLGVTRTRQLARQGGRTLGGGAVLSFEREPRFANTAPGLEIAQLLRGAQGLGLGDRGGRLVELVAQLRDDGSVVRGIRLHERQSQARRVASRGGELGLCEVEIPGAYRGIRETVVQRGRGARIELVRPQGLERVTVHRQRFGWTFVRERLGKVAKLEHSAQRAQCRTRSCDRSPVERDGLPAPAAPVGDQRAQVEDIARRPP